MSLLGNLRVKLGLDDKEFKQGMTDGQKQTSQFADRMKQFGAAMLAAFSVRAVVNFTKKAVAAYNTQAAAVAKLEAVLKSTGETAGLTSRELKKYASELQRSTTFGDEGTLEAMSRLLAFKSLQGQVFKDTIRLAQDLSTVLGVDLNSAVMQLGKALESPEIGLTMLRRSGIAFSTKQTEIIKKLVSDGKVYEAQVLILAEVQTKFGGAAKAAAEIAGGAWKQVGNSFGDLMEVIGSGTEKNKGFATSLRDWFDTLGMVLDSDALNWVEKLTVFLGGNIKAMQKAADAAKAENDYLDNIDKSASAYMVTIKDLTQAENVLSTMRKSGQSDLDKEIEKRLRVYITAEQANEAEKESIKLAEEKRLASRGNIQVLEDEIKKNEELAKSFKGDPDKLRAINTVTQGLKRQLDYLNMTVEAYKLAQYYDIKNKGKFDISSLGGISQPSVSTNVGMNTTDIYKKGSDAAKNAIKELEENEQKVNDIATRFQDSIAGIVANSIEHLTDIIAGTSDLNTAQLVSALLMPLADMAITAGTLIMFTGDAIEALRDGLTAFLGVPAIVAGAALVGIGIAAKAGLKGIASSGGGGAAASQTSFSGGTGGMKVANIDTVIKVEGVIKGNDIYISNQNAEVNRKR